MSNYGQQPPNPYQQNPYGQQPGPYGQQGPQQGPYGQPVQYGQRPQYGQPPQGPPGQGGQQNPYQQQNPYGQQPPGAYPPPQGQQPGQWVAQTPSRPTVAPRAIPVVTLDALPGREIADVVGEVVGVVARGRDLPPELRAGGMEAGYVSMLTRSRQDAVARAVEMATSAGADAILGLRFDCSEITQNMSEVVAYGTAVKLVPREGDEASSEGDASATPASAASATEPTAEQGQGQGQGQGPGDLWSRPSESGSSGWPPPENR